MYADLKYFKTHPMAERVLEDIERGIGFFGLSHNADGDVQVQADGTRLVTELLAVRSVDLVTDPATVKNLHESKGARIITIRELAASPNLSAPGKRILQTLLEMDDYGDMPIADAPTAPAPSDGRGLMAQAVGILSQSTDPADHELAMKIMKLLKPEAEPTPEEDDEMPKKDEDKKDDEKSAESAKRSAPALTEAHCKDLLDLAGMERDAELIEAMVATGDDRRAIKLVKLIKARAQAKPAANKPGARSVAQGIMPVVESKKATPPQQTVEEARQSRLHQLRGAWLAN